METLVDMLTPEVIATAQKTLGRKFEVGDLAPWGTLHRMGLPPKDAYEFAVRYAKEYEGDFEYMVDMRGNVRRTGGLTDPQVKGVLNCAAAQGRRNQPRNDGEGIKFTGVHTGHYVIDTFDLGLVYMKYYRKQNGQFAISMEDGDSQYGWTTLAIVADGVAQPTRWARPEQLEAVHLLAAGHVKAGQAFAKRTGNCYICNRVLTEGLSIASGIGPECADKYGIDRHALAEQNEGK